MLKNIQDTLFNHALKFHNKNTHQVQSYKEFQSIINKGGFVKCGWDGNAETEAKIKSETNATIRCIPMEQNIENLNCIYSNISAKYQVIFAKAY